MAEGWIKLHRCMQDNPLWEEKPFSRGQAWVDLLLLANHKDGFFRVRGVKVEVKRGQVGRSMLTLAERWGWSRGKVARFLDELEMSEQIVQQNTKLTTLITIRKYDAYQADDTTDETTNSTTDRATDRTTDGQQTDINKNEKNEKNEKKKATPLTPQKGERDALFDEFWQAYPKKVGKDAARKAWDKRNVDSLLSAKMLQAIERQRQTDQWQKENGQYIPNPSTWLNQARWEDEVPVSRGRGIDSIFFGGI